jgi:hypothetical protein
MVAVGIAACVCVMESHAFATAVFWISTAFIVGAGAGPQAERRSSASKGMIYRFMQIHLYQIRLFQLPEIGRDFSTFIIQNKRGLGTKYYTTQGILLPKWDLVLVCAQKLPPLTIKSTTDNI